MVKPRTSDRVIESLQRTPGLTSVQLAQRLNVAYNTISPIMTMLYRQGIVTREPSPQWGSGWYYSLTKKDNGHSV